MTVTKTYCDRCGAEVIYPTTRKIYLSGIGREGGYDLCDDCYRILYQWFNLMNDEMKGDNKNG